MNDSTNTVPLWQKRALLPFVAVFLLIALLWLWFYDAVEDLVVDVYVWWCSTVKIWKGEK